MPRLRLLLIITFLESLATILMERGFYFFASERMAFTQSTMLWLALGFGLMYMLGAGLSHFVTHRIGEKRLLVATLVGEAITHAALIFLWNSPAVLSVGFLLIGVLNGLKWPVVESFISAGRDHVSTSRAIGRFNIAWALAVPLALLVAGPLIDFAAPSMFVVAAAINIACLTLAIPLAAKPAHLHDDDPGRLPLVVRDRYASLLRASRWLMFGSYTLLFLLAPLMPDIFAINLGWSVRWATGLSGVMDVMRVVAFAIFQFTVFWHGRRDVLVSCVFLVPAGAMLILFGGNTGAVLAGELLFGFFAGAVYYAALYYGMIVKNASVDAGGMHEVMIGLGFAVGPLAAILGLELQDIFTPIPTATTDTAPPVATPAHAGHTAAYIWGMLCSVGPLILVISAFALRSLHRAGRVPAINHPAIDPPLAE